MSPVGRSSQLHAKCNGDQRLRRAHARHGLARAVVLAPTAQESVQWSLTATFEADPRLGSSGFAIGTRNPNAQGNPITDPVAAFPVCPGAGATAPCGSGTYSLQCDISAVPDAPNQRRMRCTDDRGNTGPDASFEAGEYDFFIVALGPIGAFPTTMSDRRYGCLRFQ